jgi:hypothetical protein
LQKVQEKNKLLGESILTKIKAIFKDAKNQLQINDDKQTKLPVKII